MPAFLSLKGTSDRLDWWITTIASAVISPVALVVALIALSEESEVNWFVLGASLVVGGLAVWAGIAVTARRFRDRRESPWMTLLLAVPVVGELWVLVVCGILPNPAGSRARVVVRQVARGGGDGANEADC